MANLSRKVAIVGIGETRVGKIPGVSAIEFQAEAARSAIMDAGVDPKEIDVVFSQSPYTQPTLMQSTQLLQYLGLSATLTATVDAGGASPATMVILAAMAISSGAYRMALCVFGEDQASFRAGTSGVALGFLSGGEEFHLPFGVTSPVVTYAMLAQRHMAVYGTTSRQLGAVAVSARKHASMNENAQKRELITIDDHQQSRMICSPLRLLDCCLISDGGGAVLLTSFRRARDCRKLPVYLLGFGGRHTHHNHMICQAPDLLDHSAKESSEAAMRMARVTINDIDVAELYDSFTIKTILQIEALGLCKPGEGGAYAEAGSLELGSRVPVNTHGGLLSQGHIDGMLHITEAVKQLRHEAGQRQVKGAEVALVTGSGGTLSTHVTLILGR